MDPEEIINGISAELLDSLKQMGKAESSEEKRAYSEVVKNLCESLEVFFNIASDMGDVLPFDDDDEPNASY
jgi:hypothetical protein